MVIDGTAWERPDQKRGPDSNGREERLIPHDIKYFFFCMYLVYRVLYYMQLNSSKNFCLSSFLAK